MWLLADKRDHLQVDSEVSLSLEGDSDGEADVVCIKLRCCVAIGMRNPGNHKPYVPAYRNLSMGWHGNADQRHQQDGGRVQHPDACVFVLVVGCHCVVFAPLTLLYLTNKNQGSQASAWLQGSKQDQAGIFLKIAPGFSCR